MNPAQRAVPRRDPLFCWRGRLFATKRLGAEHRPRIKFISVTAVYAAGRLSHRLREQSSCQPDISKSADNYPFFAPDLSGT